MEKHYRQKIKSPIKLYEILGTTKYVIVIEHFLDDKKIEYISTKQSNNLSKKNKFDKHYNPLYDKLYDNLDELLDDFIENRIIWKRQEQEKEEIKLNYSSIDNLKKDLKDEIKDLKNEIQSLRKNGEKVFELYKLNKKLDNNSFVLFVNLQNISYFSPFYNNVDNLIKDIINNKITWYVL